MTPEKFVKKHGFPGTPAGDRMLADLERVRRTTGEEVAQAIEAVDPRLGDHP
jgi:hypothetical protein